MFISPLLIYWSFPAPSDQLRILFAVLIYTFDYDFLLFLFFWIFLCKSLTIHQEFVLYFVSSLLLAFLTIISSLQHLKFLGSIYRLKLYTHIHYTSKFLERFLLHFFYYFFLLIYSFISSFHQLVLFSLLPISIHPFWFLYYNLQFSIYLLTSVSVEYLFVLSSSLNTLLFRCKLLIFYFYLDINYFCF